MLGIRRGWEGLTHQRRARRRTRRYVVPLDRINTRDHRPHRRHLAAHARARTRARCKATPAAAPRAERAAEHDGDGEDRYDLTPVVLENIERLGLDYLVPIGGDDTLSFAADAARRTACRSSPSPRPWTTTSRAPSTASASRPPSRAPRSHQPPAHDARLARAHRRLPHLRPRRRLHGAVHGLRDRPAAASSPRRPSTSTSWSTCWPRTTPQPQPLRLRHRRRGRHRGRAARIDEVGEPDAFGHRHKANVAEILAAEIKSRTGIETVFSELTYDLRSGEPDSRRPDGRHHLRQRRPWTSSRDGVSGRMMAIRDGKYAHSPLPDPELGARHVDVDDDVQRGALPAALRRACWASRCCWATAWRRSRTDRSAGTRMHAELAAPSARSACLRRVLASGACSSPSCSSSS